MALLKALVIGMGVLIVGAMSLLAYGLITKTGGGDEVAATTPMMTSASLPELGDIVIPDAASCRIDDARTEGRHMTVTLGGAASCRRAVVIDLGTGAIVAQIRLAPAEP